MVVTFAGFSLAKPDSFLTVLTLKAIPRDAAPLLVVALGATVVLVMNEFDLSIGGLLGFAGTLFVRSKEDLDRVCAVGPMQVLRAVAMPRDAA